MDNLVGMAESAPLGFQYRMISAPVQLSGMKTEQEKMGVCIEKEQPEWLRQRCVNSEPSSRLLQKKAGEINGFERATAL